MPRTVAFLRAINVGGRTVTMDRLRSIFGAVGLGGVATHIASGNVSFDTPADHDPDPLEARIEGALRDALGYPVDTFLRSDAELAATVERRPFQADSPGEGESLQIAFLKGPIVVESLGKLDRYRGERDAFAAVGREFYWLRRGKVSDSEFSGAALEKAVGKPATFRNVTTLRRILTALRPH